VDGDAAFGLDFGEALVDDQTVAKISGSVIVPDI
jgi:hypothetical protein